MNLQRPPVKTFAQTLFNNVSVVVRSRLQSVADEALKTAREKDAQKLLELHEKHEERSFSFRCSGHQAVAISVDKFGHNIQHYPSLAN